MTHTNSPLVTYTNISPNRNSPRNHSIDTITIHCMCAQWTAKQCCDYFAKESTKASSNYCVGKDGSIGLSVEEKDRSWCTSNRPNDHRAITIEVASDKTAPHKVSEKAYNALIDLLVDICKRNNIKRLLWKADKTLIGQPEKQNMTVHRWYANKSCPGDYLYNLHSQIADEVNKRLSQPYETIQIELPILRKGSKGSEVRTLQKLLIINGCSVGKSGVDGSFGTDTLNGVKEYQKKRHLTIDGIVGINTWIDLLKG